MQSFERVPNPRFQPWLLAVATVLAAGCQPEAPATATAVAIEQAVTISDVGKQCGLQCPEKGIAQGNASISGVASVDAFFQAVLDYRAKANNVSSGIDAQLAAIGSDFGLASGADLSVALMEKISANVEGGLTVDAEPARCAVDVQSTLNVQAHCEASVKPAKATCGCRGRCEVQANAKVDCGASAELECTVNAPMATCQGKCQGACVTQLDTAARCAGTCRGTCSGRCRAYAHHGDGSTQCAGDCEGMCQGACEARIAAKAECTGSCNGECSLPKADGNCEGGIHAHCVAMSNAMVDCGGRCEGEIVPPKGKAECEASAKAEAKLNVQCTPPRLVVKYVLKAGLDATAEAQFVAAAKNLELRLPALFAAIGEASSVTEAQVELIGDGRTAVKTAIQQAVSDKTMLAARLVGLGCALGELDAVDSAIDKANTRLSVSLDTSTKLQAALMATSS
jgi:hypothetical protein